MYLKAMEKRWKKHKGIELSLERITRHNFVQNFTLY